MDYIIQSELKMNRQILQPDQALDLIQELKSSQGCYGVNIKKLKGKRKEKKEQGRL